MTIELDHFVVPARNQQASAKLLAQLLGVPVGNPDAPAPRVYINKGLTLAFVARTEEFPVHHYCFRVTEKEFDSIFDRIEKAGIKYRSTAKGPANMQINKEFGGRNVFWDEPEGHEWEILTVSYARPPKK